MFFGTTASWDASELVRQWEIATRMDFFEYYVECSGAIGAKRVVRRGRQRSRSWKGIKPCRFPPPSKYCTAVPSSSSNTHSFISTIPYLTTTMKSSLIPLLALLATSSYAQPLDTRSPGPGPVCIPPSYGQSPPYSLSSAQLTATRMRHRAIPQMLLPGVHREAPDYSHPLPSRRNRVRNTT